MTRHLVRFGGATAIATILLFRPAATDAAVLLPGSVVVPNVLTGSAGTLIDSVTAPLGSVGSITAAVVQNGLGTLDFYYQIANNAGSGVDPTSNVNLLFRSVSQIFATSVFYRVTNGGLGIFSSGDAGATPGSASRDPFWSYGDVWFWGLADRSRRNVARARDSHECDRLHPWSLVRGEPHRRRRRNVWPCWARAGGGARAGIAGAALERVRRGRISRAPAETQGANTTAAVIRAMLKSEC